MYIYIMHNYDKMMLFTIANHSELVQHFMPRIYVSLVELNLQCPAHPQWHLGLSTDKAVKRGSWRIPQSQVHRCSRPGFEGWAWKTCRNKKLRTEQRASLLVAKGIATNGARSLHSAFLIDVVKGVRCTAAESLCLNRPGGNPGFA